MSERLRDAVIRRADAEKKPIATLVREILAFYLGRPNLAMMPPARVGRPRKEPKSRRRRAG